MALIVEGTIEREPVYREGISSFRLALEKAKLSLPYELSTLKSYSVQGEILLLKKSYGTVSQDELKAMEQVKGKPVEFYLLLSVIGTYDYLYFTDSSWAILRDAGFTTRDYLLRVRLHKLVAEEKESDLYPVRDVS